MEDRWGFGLVKHLGRKSPASGKGWSVWVLAAAADGEKSADFSDFQRFSLFAIATARRIAQSTQR
jgi:hypothetical protein